MSKQIRDNLIPILKKKTSIIYQILIGQILKVFCCWWKKLRGGVVEKKTWKDVQIVLNGLKIQSADPAGGFASIINIPTDFIKLLHQITTVRKKFRDILLITCL